MFKTPNQTGRRERSKLLRRNSNTMKHDKKALKAEVERLLQSAGLECGFPANPAVVIKPGAVDHMPHQ